MPRRIEIALQLLIVLSALAFAVETLPDLSPTVRTFLTRFEATSVTVFTIEYLVRLAIAPKSLRFAFSFFGIVDLISILPFWLSFGIDLRSVRSVRLLRAFRLLKLARYESATRRISLAFSIAKEEFFLFLCFTVFALYFAAVGIYWFENEAQPEAFSSVPHSLWWAVVTLTTVGYGDTYPVTAGGRVFTGLMLLIGLGIVSVPAGLISSAMQEARKTEKEEKEKAKRARQSRPNRRST